MIQTVPDARIGRRHFIGSLVAAAGAATLLGPGRGLLDVLPFMGDAAPFTRAEVSTRIGERFRIAEGVHRGVTLLIDSIVELPGVRVPVVPDDQFAARFTAPGAELASDMYWFASKSFGKLPLYISPLVDADGVTTGYEALVNRYVPPAMAAYLASQEARS
jgi:hypothetical protein